ncbi:hypothetical protein ACJ2A9_14075 [Anaerobacillus sp. MEB173]|uniref:hypothetical protein n=1 Tax=Anaerobacillus sp. MEB173 TaxID=3383345 RepID=UPI003F9213CF
MSVVFICKLNVRIVHVQLVIVVVIIVVIVVVAVITIVTCHLVSPPFTKIIM